MALVVGGGGEVRDEEEREEEEGPCDRHCCVRTQSPRWAVCVWVEDHGFGGMG
jgi:hypothetical protein